MKTINYPTFKIEYIISIVLSISWMGIVDTVKTKILSSNDNIFIPKLIIQV